MKAEVLVGMSGGVDSTVCCALLKREYSVRGLYCIMSDAHLPGIGAARQAAGELSVPLSVEDVRERFRREVSAPFISEYCSGSTPNPCVVCNPLVKFAALTEVADRMGIRRIATGHYARTGTKDGRAVLKKSSDHARDQSYMLYRLSEETLSRLLLPLGGLSKRGVREIAAENGFLSAGAPDSQEICFIPDGGHPEYIRRHGAAGKPGRFIAPDGSDAGRHKGVEHYTVGQRKGLGSGFGRPVFVRRILENGDILLTDSGGEYATEVVAGDAVLNPAFTLEDITRPSVKLRSAQRAVSCSVRRLSESGFLLSFGEPQRAPAPGQSAVLYDGDTLIGGGVIRDFR